MSRRKGESDELAAKRAYGQVYAATLDSYFSTSHRPREVEPSPPKKTLKDMFRQSAGGSSAVGAAADSSEAPVSPKRRGRPSKDASTAQGSQDESGNAAAVDQRSGRTVEQIYQKKTQLEHILLRPDSYVGSTEKQSQEHWVYDDKEGRMIRQKLEYVPALYKIFDEILVNAADNMVRSPLQDRINVDIDAKQGFVSVWNNGNGLPVQVHKEHQCYVPELVFGHLLTSDNYDDDERKVTGGRNGYGAKLTNIFSSMFILETADSNSGKRYKQVWENNMSKRHSPEITAHTGEDFTCVTFYPDFTKFGMKAFEKDILALMRRRAYDVAAATHGKCQVYLDQKPLAVKSFEDFVALHLEPDSFRVCEVVSDRWEVAVGLVPDGSGFQQVSFVNSISTSRGGTHVNAIVDQLVNPILESVGKQKSGLAVKASHVRGYLMVFVNCLIENPAFDSQTKETLTSKKERFGSTCNLPESLINAVLESGVLQALQEWSKALGRSELAQYLNRSDMGNQKRLFGIPKLEDANKAGTKQGGECTLILTEGDSAKALAVAGLSVIGRDLYGVFPLRGKLRNVRELSIKQLLENKELDQVMRILALDASKSYDSVKGLRYGSIMIMTDQDHDGSHIKGLIINFLNYWFPSLLKIPGFLKEFVTPIVKVNKGEDTQTFFTVPEYNAWKEENNGGHGWKSKYYKGLGTSTSTEAREYFASMEDHEILFTHEGEEDDNLIDMAFASARADDRKQWISRCEEGTCVDHTQATISYKEFVDKELVLYAKYDVERMIPSVVDGFKPGQRKVLFGCFKKKLNSDIKVAQLSGYVAEQSAYHHGETSLQGTIIGMAQTYVGSNNINLLIPSGQFGTRLQGGKDHAAARYIFTRLSKATRCIFPEADDAVLEYLSDEGVSIEPKWYCPIIPLVAVNGADGIGVGWSTSVPNYNPRDLIANVRRLLRQEPLQDCHPWYRGFKGSITAVPDTQKYEVTGLAVKRGRTRLEITELPIRRWTQDYKEWLIEQLPKSNNEHKAQITEMREYHTEHSVHFVLSMTPHKLAEADRRGLQKTFHLKGSLSTTNMMLFDPDGKIKKYESLEQIIRDHAKVRLDVYGKRKEYILAKLRKELDLIDQKLRFVQLVVTETLEVDGRKSRDLCRDMRGHGLKYKQDVDLVPDRVELSETEQAGPLGYKYLLGMKMWTLTDDQLQKLKALHQKKAAEVADMEATTLEELWDRDLVKLEEALDAIDREDAKEAEAAAKLAKKKGFDDDGLINRQCVLVLSQDFKAKRVGTDQWRAARSGKKINQKSGLLAKKVFNRMQDQEVQESDSDDAEVDAECLRDVFCCHDFDALLVFSLEGNVFSLQALEVPAVKKANSAGIPIKDFLPELGNEHVAAMVSIPQGALRDQSDEFVILVSAHGLAKKVSIDKFRGLDRARKGGLSAFKLASGDKLKWALRATVNCALIIATTNGHAMRVPLGAEFGRASVKGPGRKIIKTNAKTGRVATCSVIELTKKEQEQIAEEKEQALKRKEERKALALQEASKGVDDSGLAEKLPTPSRNAKKSEVDDDDSGNEGNEGENQGDDPQADGDDAEDMDADDGESDGEVADGDAQMTPISQTLANASGASAGGPVDATATAGEASTVAYTGPQDKGPCVLLLSEKGFGMRFPLSHKRMKLMKPGRCPTRVMKLGDNDELIGACVVSGMVPEQKPDSKKPWQIFYRENKDALETEFQGLSEENRAQIESDASKDQQEDDAANPDKIPCKGGLFLVPYARRKFNELPESEKQPYNERAEAEEKQYQEALDEYRSKNPEVKQSQEQVMIGSKMGCISRVLVETVPVLEGIKKGRCVCKPKGKDVLSTISLLSAADVEVDEDPVAAPNPANVTESAEGEAGLEEKPKDQAEVKVEDNRPAPPKARTTPRKIFQLRRASSAALALPNTPPTNKKQVASGEGLAAAAMLGTPGAESPRLRIRGKKSVEDAMSPSRIPLSVDNVARPSLGRSSSAMSSQSREGSAKKMKGKQVGVRKTISKRALEPLRLTPPAFSLE